MFDYTLIPGKRNCTHGWAGQPRHVEQTAPPCLISQKQREFTTHGRGEVRKTAHRANGTQATHKHEFDTEAFEIVTVADRNRRVRGGRWRGWGRRQCI